MSDTQQIIDALLKFRNERDWVDQRLPFPIDKNITQLKQINQSNLINFNNYVKIYSNGL